MKYDFVLSGRVTGNAGYREQFAKVAAFLRGRDAVARVFNPAELPEGRSEAWYMARCLRAVFRSKSVLRHEGPICDDCGIMCELMALPPSGGDGMANPKGLVSPLGGDNQHPVVGGQND